MSTKCMRPLYILSVDDERDLEFLITKKYQARIQAEELVFYFAHDGEAALQQLAQHPQIAVVLCDINMPGMDGLTLLQHLIDHHPYVCPVMVTAYDDMGNIRSAMQRGAFDFLTKPIDFADLDATLHKAACHARRIRAAERCNLLISVHARSALAVIRDSHIVYVNEAWQLTFDDASDTLIRQHVDDLLSSEGRLPDDAHLLPGMMLKNVEFATCHLSDETQELYLETCHWDTFWEGKPAAIVMVNDVTNETRRKQQDACHTVALQKKLQVMRNTVKTSQRFGNLVGASEAMHRVYERILSAAACTEPVVIWGESGTGKELVARMIHQLSERSAQQLVPVNCGAIPDGLFEREMFGHQQGAFTGAVQTQPGWYEAAHQGTLFLDEMGELSKAQQVKLLRALESGEYTRIGSITPKQADVRLIAAMNRDPRQLVQSGLMRKDFFYRLHVIEIMMPPLRDRLEDIPLLVEHFLTTTEGDEVPMRLPRHLLEKFTNYTWPGNVRELRQLVRCYVFTGHLTFSGSQHNVGDNGSASTADADTPTHPPLQDAVEAFEKRLILQMLAEHGGHRANTATVLGIPERTLYRKMKKFRIE